MMIVAISKIAYILFEVKTEFLYFDFSLSRNEYVHCTFLGLVLICIRVHNICEEIRWEYEESDEGKEFHNYIRLEDQEFQYLPTSHQ